MSFHPVTPATPKRPELTVALCINPEDGHQLEEHFRFGLDELHVPLVPSSTFQVQAVDIDALCGRGRNVVLRPLGDFVAKHHVVQSPALVGPRYLLHKVSGKTTRTSAMRGLSPHKDTTMTGQPHVTPMQSKQSIIQGV